jgi:hypothetical protein
MLKGFKKQTDVKLKNLKRYPGLKMTSPVVPDSRPAFRGQVSLEFTFCMIIVLIMIYGVMRVFQWTGRDLAERRIAHERILTDSSSQGDCKPGWVDDPSGGPPTWDPCATTVSLREVALNQVDPYFYAPVTMNAVWNGT